MAWGLARKASLSFDMGVWAFRGGHGEARSVSRGLTVLPGLRKIRTPLAAGYCWLGLAWLIVRDHLPARDQARGLIADLYEVAFTVGKPGLVVIGSFVAYLLGALTVQFMMLPLSAVSVPRDAKTLFLRRPELTDRTPSYANFRAELTAPYAMRGLMPRELTADDRLRDTFSRLSAEAEFRWTVPVPVIAGCIYLGLVSSWLWFLPALLAPALMYEGRTRFIAACRLLSQAGLAEVSRQHGDAMRTIAGAEAAR